MPVTSARRADTAGIDSGIARLARSDFPVRSFRFGVFAWPPSLKAPTWLERTSGSTTITTPRARSSPSFAAAGAAPAERPEHAGAGGGRAAAAAAGCGG